MRSVFTRSTNDDSFVNWFFVWCSFFLIYIGALRVPTVFYSWSISDLLAAGENRRNEKKKKQKIMTKNNNLRQTIKIMIADSFYELCSSVHAHELSVCHCCDHKYTFSAIYANTINDSTMTTVSNYWLRFSQRLCDFLGWQLD